MKVLRVEIPVPTCASHHRRSAVASWLTRRGKRNLAFQVFLGLFGLMSPVAAETPAQSIGVGMVLLAVVAIAM